jgi:RNase H-fold protein (predicted Holliday junction resolvase)
VAQAEAELKARGKPFTKEAIDALSATYILEDYLRAKI